jgi:NAD(P)-dependent dehydrogenase (short-subunit alcohol dehydrogenase family)
MSGPMQGKIIAVTGAAGALGRALVQVAVARGARVAAIDFAPPPDALKADVGAGGLLLGGVDLTDAAAAKTAFEAVGAGLGGLDVLVNIAGGFRWETLAEGKSDTWDFLYRINVATAANACRAALPLLRQSPHGAIVNIGAGAALKAGAGMGAYAASKAGVHRLTESLAEELKGEVTVNAVLPSIIDTPVNRKDMPDADFSKWVQPADLADAILFLATNRAVTGALLPVNGKV